MAFQIRSLILLIAAVAINTSGLALLRAQELLRYDAPRMGPFPKSKLSEAIALAVRPVLEPSALKAGVVLREHLQPRKEMPVMGDPDRKHVVEFLLYMWQDIHGDIIDSYDNTTPRQLKELGLVTPEESRFEYWAWLTVRNKSRALLARQFAKEQGLTEVQSLFDLQITRLNAIQDYIAAAGYLDKRASDAYFAAFTESAVEAGLSIAFHRISQSKNKEELVLNLGLAVGQGLFKAAEVKVVNYLEKRKLNSRISSATQLCIDRGAGIFRRASRNSGVRMELIPAPSMSGNYTNEERWANLPQKRGYDPEQWAVKNPNNPYFFNFNSLVGTSDNFFDESNRIMRRIPIDPFFDDVRAKLASAYMQSMLYAVFDLRSISKPLRELTDSEGRESWEFGIPVLAMRAIDACRNNAQIEEVRELYGVVFLSTVQLGKLDLARPIGAAMLEHSDGEFDNSQEVWYVYAKCCLANSDTEGSLKALRRLAKSNRGKSYFELMSQDADFRSLTRDKRFTAIAAKAKP